MTFAELLRLKMAEHSMTIDGLAQLTGLNGQTIVNLRRGLNDPQPKTSVRLADALECPELVRVGLKPRRRYCEMCRQRFVTSHNDPNKRRYCNRKCQQAAWARRQASGRATVERKARYQLSAAMTAIASFCGSCEPFDRVCRDATCALREFSPLPLVTRRKAA